MEIRVIPAFPQYRACANGDIIGARGWILTPFKNDYGYLQVNVSKDGVIDTISVHRLIANAFLGLNLNDRSVDVDHINENKEDCRVKNLQLLTKSCHQKKTLNHYSQNDSETHKQCRTCKEIKLRKEFYRSKSHFDQLDFQCKACCKERYRKRALSLAPRL